MMMQGLKRLYVVCVIPWLILAMSFPPLIGVARAGDAAIYTLYRSSPIDATMRIHVATFDADDGDAYNHENCEIARELFAGQQGVKAKYWCERGRYRK
jgi:hypothetical protein